MRQPTAIDGRFADRAEILRSAPSACALPALTLLLTSPWASTVSGRSGTGAQGIRSRASWWINASSRCGLA